MANAVSVKIVPGSPAPRIIARNDEEKVVAEAALRQAPAGLTVEVEQPATTEATADAAKPEAPTEDGDKVEPVCDLQPDKPWADSVCRKLADAAADKVLDRLQKGLADLRRGGVTFGKG